MVDNEDRPEDNGHSLEDSRELFETLFTQELEAFRKDKQEKIKARTLALKRKATEQKARIAARQKTSPHPEGPAGPKKRIITATTPAPQGARPAGKQPSPSQKSAIPPRQIPPQKAPVAPPQKVPSQKAAPAPPTRQVQTRKVPAAPKKVSPQKPPAPPAVKKKSVAPAPGQAMKAATVKTKPVPEKKKIPAKTRAQPKKPGKIREEKAQSAGRPTRRINKGLILGVLVFAGCLAAFLLNYQTLFGPKKQKTPTRAETVRPKASPVRKKIAAVKAAKVPMAPSPRGKPSEDRVATQTPGPVKPKTWEKDPVAKIKHPEMGQPAKTSTPERAGTQVKAAPVPLPKKPVREPLPPDLPLRERVASYPYSIYFGSYSDRTELQNSVLEYQKMGMNPYWVRIDLGEKGIWYRLFSGYYGKRSEVKTIIKGKQLKEASSKHTKYANLIGFFQSEAELEIKKKALLDAGYSPYTVKGKRGEFVLYAGAFYQKKRAVQLHRELVSNGIENRVVER